METMEYAIDQSVIFDSEEMLRGKLSNEEYAAIFGTRSTGKITGHFSTNFIIALDIPLRDGTKAVLVPSAVCRPLNCHWCQDRKKLHAYSFTGGQSASDTIPVIDCAYCPA